MTAPVFPISFSSKLIGNDLIRFSLSHKKVLRHPDDILADPIHKHDCVEILFSLSGDISFASDERIFPIRLGDAVISAKGTPHACIYNTTSIHEHFCLWIDAPNPNELFPFLFSDGDITVLKTDEKIMLALTEKLTELEALAADGENQLSESAVFLSVMAVLSSCGKSSGSDGQPEEFKKILKKIDEDFCLIQKLSDIESARFISASTLNRWFKKYTNLSPKEFIETKKLYYAARLLASGAGVTDACMQSGFSDCSHFIALFKKKFGETPLKYKKRYEGDFFLTLEKTNDL